VTPARDDGPLRVLARNRDFRWLFAAELVIFGGDWFVLIPLLGLLGRLTGGGLAGGLALAIDTGVNALLLPYTGTVADRIDRRKILVIANLSAVAGVALLFTVHSAATAWLGLLGVAVVAVAKAFASPAASAAIPNLVEPVDLSAAVAVTGAAWGTMSVVGASLGGVLAAALSPYAWPSSSTSNKSRSTPKSTATTAMPSTWRLCSTNQLKAPVKLCCPPELAPPPGPAN